MHTSPFRLRLEGSTLPYHLDEALTAKLEVYAWIRREYLRVKRVRDVQGLFDVAIYYCRSYTCEISARDSSAIGIDQRCLCIESMSSL